MCWWRPRQRLPRRGDSTRSTSIGTIIAISRADTAAQRRSRVHVCSPVVGVYSSVMVADTGLMARRKYTNMSHGNGNLLQIDCIIHMQRNKSGHNLHLVSRSSVPVESRSA
ncbi:uncharacterized protein LOC107269263 isoform X3 [Cephus cinctus]|uniref:Uncharacterized protein LOC107269263 isoform X3 n=1 Tax=Cephus cinctus TaxID=211228 RepID=A0AAJ7FLZ8_CEPCN|nr:uncharacterized protein LOC107269263 isoform X3 [Cephus cinctus]